MQHHNNRDSDNFVKYKNRNRYHRDFELFYLTHRCPSSPASPERISRLCRGTLVKEYGKWLLPEDVIGQAKSLLIRMFDDYDPSRYRGRLRQEDNFVNLFMKRMRGRLYRFIRPPTDKGNRGRADKFPHMPELGLVNTIATKGRNWCDELVQLLPEALLKLAADEYQVVIKRYYEDKSFAAISREMNICDKTVKTKHDNAINKLQRFYHVEIN